MWQNFHSFLVQVIQILICIGCFSTDTVKYSLLKDLCITDAFKKEIDYMVLVLSLSNQFNQLAYTTVNNNNKKTNINNIVFVCGTKCSFVFITFVVTTFRQEIKVNTI